MICLTALFLSGNDKAEYLEAGQGDPRETRHAGERGGFSPPPGRRHLSYCRMIKPGGGKGLEGEKGLAGIAENKSVAGPDGQAAGGKGVAGT